ncbi:short chain dehydrogenase, partial [Burkholderia sp. H160]
MDRVVLVTGACGGIGSVLCERFVEAGDTVLALDIDAAALQSLCARLGADKVVPVAVDLGDAAAVQQAVAAAVAQRGPV